MSKIQMAVPCLCVLLAVSTVFMTQSVFVEIAARYGLAASSARLAFSVTAICYGLSFLWAGPAADQADLGKMVFWGLVCLAGALAGAARAGSFALFILAMAVAGSAAAAVAAAVFPYVVRAMPGNRQGIGLGALVAASTTGMVAGRWVTGVAAQGLGLSAAFDLTAAAGAALAVAALAGMDKAWTAPVQQGKSGPKMLCTRQVWPFLLTGFLIFFGFLGMVTFLTFRLSGPPFNFTSAAIGWISLAGLTALPSAPAAGLIAGRTGVFPVVGIALLAGIAGIQIMGWGSTPGLVITGMLLVFAGVYFCQPLVFLVISRNVPRTSTGTASSVYMFVCIGGGSLAALVLGPVWSAFGWQGITLACSGSLVLGLGLWLGFWPMTLARE